jgi:uncharacterized protein YfiM (DUF2279 family)
LRRRRLPTAALVAALSLCPGVAGADSWWGADKALHLSVSLALGATAYGGLWLASDDGPAVKLALGWSLAMLPGLAKEIYDDGQPGNSFSGADMLYNALGALVGCGALLTIELVLARRRGPPARVTLGPWGRGVALGGTFDGL